MQSIPLRFEPVLKRTIWGGRKLGDVLGKPLGDHTDYAESWEIVDHGADQSRVVGGDLTGRTLGELFNEHPQWLLGQHAQTDRFPLLLKYLDCNRVLSVQVHPDDAYGLKMTEPDLGKTEAWYIVSADPGSLIYAGLKQGVGPKEMRAAVEEGKTENVLHSFHPDPGDCVFIPAGTVHALGAGLLVCEIQQSSDTTFRLFDWNRVNDQGESRPLHIEPSLEVTDYQSGPVRPRRVQADRSGWQTLVDCDKFVFRSLSIGSEILGGDNRMHLITVPAGSATITHQQREYTMTQGQTILLPAAISQVEVTPADQSRVLTMCLPRG